MRYKSCTDYWLDTETGRFRGDFEGMYRDIPDPWGCEERKSSLNNRIFLEAVFAGDRRFRKILDVGCGLGGLLSTIRQRNGGGVVLGIDVSATAVEKARHNYPDLRFEHRNLVADGMDEGDFDLVVVSEVLWYVLDDLTMFYDRVAGALTRGGALAVHQYFPAEQRYGRDVIDGVSGYFAFMARRPELSKEYVVRSDHPDGLVLSATFTKNR